MRLAILFNSGSRDVDGVADHARMLGGALAREGHSVSLIDYRGGRWCLADASGRSAVVAATVASVFGSADWVILEYSPFGMARWGFAPWTIRWARVAARRGRLAVFVHEPYVREGRGRQRLIALWQRLQLRLLLRWAAAAAVPIEQSCEIITSLRPDLPVAHIPVGSNLPDRSAERASRRAELGIQDGLVVAVFSTGHESRLEGHLALALHALSAAGHPVLALNLGAGANPLPAFERITTISPGWLKAHVLAEYLSAADIFLSPLADGASMRRTTIAAALQHGVPVISTDGHLTDRQLRADDNGLEMVKVEDAVAFGNAAGALASNPSERERRRERARLAYADLWSWPRIAEQTLTLLRTGLPSRVEGGPAAEESPTVAISIPTYNQADHLGASVRSAYEQDYPGHLEVWVFDDASTDKTAAVLQDLAREFPDLRVVRHPENGGIARNASAALRTPATEMVVRLDSDDVLEPPFVTRLTRLLTVYPDAGIAHSAVREINELGQLGRTRRLARRTGFQPADVALRASLSGHRTTANIMMFRKAALERVHYCEGRPDYVEDYDLSVRLAEAGWGNAYTEEPLARYRVWTDAHGMRARRKALQLNGYRRIFEEVVIPGWTRRGWDRSEVSRQRRRLAARNCASCFAAHYTQDETDELVRLLIQLGDGPHLRLRLLACRRGLAEWLEWLDAVPYRVKSMVKRLLASRPRRPMMRS